MNRLRAYRDIEGINQAELGEQLGISPTMVSAIESGRRPFAGDLTKLGYSPERLNLPPMSPPLHRHKASTHVSAKKRAHELLRLAGEVFRELRDRTPRAPEMRLERFTSPMSMDDIEELAIETRSMLDHEEVGPIQNLTAALERAGVCLVPMVGLAGIDGLSSWVDGTPVIGVSPTVPGDRFRFTLSHELCHLLCHPKKSEASEKEANRFAGALLFPRDEFDAAMPDRPVMTDFINLKRHWGVAVSALVYRAHDLEHIDDARYRGLQVQMTKAWKRVEPGSFEPAQGQLFGRLVEVNGGADVVAADLGINVRHLRALLSWSHLRVA